MKTVYLSSIVSALVLLSGCGGGSSSSSSASSVASGANTNVIQVVRGPLLGAIVKDATGKVATDLQDGKGNYSFNGTINYPVTARGGVIDTDRDGKISAGDVKNDLELKTESGNVVTMVTTYAASPVTKTLLEKVASDFNVSLSELEKKTPLDSKEVEAISNVMYKFAQDNNISTGTTGEIEKEIKREYEKYSSESHDSTEVEKSLLEELTRENKLEKIDENNLETEKSNLENEYKSELNKYEKEHGDSDYVASGSFSSHYQGESCLSCHGANGNLSSGGEAGETGEAGENQFTSGATIFTKLNGTASEAASAYTLRLVLENVGTTVAYNQARGSGNVNASFATGTLNGYTAEVLNASGTVVNKSLQNTHDVTRLDCNRCHTTSGANGAPGRIVSFDYYGAGTTTGSTTTGSSTATTGTGTTTGSSTNNTVVAKSFATDVLPILQNKCQSCHGGSGNFSITNSATPYAGVSGFVTASNATDSRLLQKASNSVSHGGGTVLASMSSEYKTIRDWILEGAKNN